VSENKDIQTVKYNCPMDYLFEEMDGLDYADQRKNLSMKVLLVERKIKNGDRKQQDKIVGYVYDKCKKLDNVYNKYRQIQSITENEKRERDRIVDDTIKYYDFYVGKLKVGEDTMYSLLLKIALNKKDKIATKMLNILYKTQKEVFLSTFSNKNSTL